MVSVCQESSVVMSRALAQAQGPSEGSCSLVGMLTELAGQKQHGAVDLPLVCADDQYESIAR